MPCSASRVVPGAHRVVGPGTHRGSEPREVHTTGPPPVGPCAAPAGRPLRPRAAPEVAVRAHAHDQRSVRDLLCRARPSMSGRRTMEFKPGVPTSPWRLEAKPARLGYKSRCRPSSRAHDVVVRHRRPHGELLPPRAAAQPRWSLPSCLLRSVAGQHAGGEAPCGYRPPASPSTAAGCSSVANNPRNGTLGEPTPLSRPFPAEPSLPLTGIELPPPAMAPGTQLQPNFSSRGPVCEIWGPVRKTVSSRSRWRCRNL
jgi:hypothetical protein